MVPRCSGSAASELISRSKATCRFGRLRQACWMVIAAWTVAIQVRQESPWPYSPKEGINGNHCHYTNNHRFRSCVDLCRMKNLIETTNHTNLNAFFKTRQERQTVYINMIISCCQTTVTLWCEFTASFPLCTLDIISLPCSLTCPVFCLKILLNNVKQISVAETWRQVAWYYFRQVQSHLSELPHLLLFH